MSGIYLFIYLKSQQFRIKPYRRPEYLNANSTLNNGKTMNGELNKNFFKADQVDLVIKNKSRKLWSNETRGRYTVLKNFVSSDSIITDTENGITLTTQTTYQYLYHIEEQCKRWEGPISVAN